MSGSAFTGERLHDDAPLFAVDLVRHRVAYDYASPHLRGRRTLELGCGTGYGAAGLASAGVELVGLDKVPPDRPHRVHGVRFVRADLEALPLPAAGFDAVVSFQVVEHLADPSRYLAEMVRVLRPGGVAWLSTPNRLTSDGENPFHLREYTAEELREALAPYFGEVEMLGVGARGEVARYYAERLERIRRIVRLDPLGLRRRIPRGFVEWLFARLAVVVRRGIAGVEGLPEATDADFPIGPADSDCLDLLAVCRMPRSPS